MEYKDLIAGAGEDTDKETDETRERLSRAAAGILGSMKIDHEKIAGLAGFAARNAAMQLGASLVDSQLLVNLREQIAKSTMSTFADQIAAQRTKILEQMSEMMRPALIDKSELMKSILGAATVNSQDTFARMFESFNPVERHKAEMQKIIDAMKPRTLHHQADNEINYIRHNRPTFNFKLPEHKPVNSAQIAIDDFSAELEARTEDAGFGKFIHAYLLAGEREIWIETLQAVNAFTIKVEGYDRAGKFVVVKIKCNNFQYLFEENEISPEKLKNIH